MKNDIENKEFVGGYLPKPLAKWLKKRAEKNNRNVTKELIDTLETVKKEEHKNV